MEYLYNYDSFLTESLFRKKNNIYKKIHNDLLSQFYFLTTFNVSILGLYPIVEKLLFNHKLDLDLTPYQIVLLTIFGVAELTHNLKDDLSDLSYKLKEKGIYKYTNIIKKIFLSLKTIFIGVSKSFGKTIDKFTDMLGFVFLIVPFNNILLHLTTEYNLDYDTLWNITTFGVIYSTGVFTLKSIIYEILKYLKKNENFDTNLLIIN